MPLLIFLFFITAALYASVGFGGGSTYSALLVLHGVDYQILPSIALICNIIVVTGGTISFARAGHLKFQKLLPFIAASVPAAWIGGRIPISEVVFVGVLGLSLLAAGLRIAFEKDTIDKSESPSTSTMMALFIGGALGFVSGLVGIGGGIFLAPVLYVLRWGSPRQIAGAASFFILVNSLAGLVGQTMKLSDLGAASAILNYWMLFPAVLIGGQIGSRLATTGISPTILKRLT